MYHRLVTFVAILLTLGHTPGIASDRDEAVMGGAQAWVQTARNGIATARVRIEERVRLTAELTRAGMPAEDSPDPDGQRFMKWYMHAGEQDETNLERLKETRLLIVRGIMELWVNTAMGAPVLKRNRADIVADAPAILDEYEAILSKRGNMAFPDAFMDELDRNVKALKGVYYRQAALVLCAHISQLGVVRQYGGEIASLEQPDTDDRAWLKRVFAEWYYQHLQYGYRWTTDRKTGATMLRPQNGDSFVLVGVDLGPDEPEALQGRKSREMSGNMK